MQIFAFFHEYCPVRSHSETFHCHKLDKYKDEEDQEAGGCDSEILLQCPCEFVVIHIVDEVKGSQAHCQEHDCQSHSQIEQIRRSLKSVPAARPGADDRGENVRRGILVHDEL